MALVPGLGMDLAPLSGVISANVHRFEKCGARILAIVVEAIPTRKRGSRSEGTYNGTRETDGSRRPRCCGRRPVSTVLVGAAFLSGAFTPRRMSPDWPAFRRVGRTRTAPGSLVFDEPGHALVGREVARDHHPPGRGGVAEIRST